MSEREETEAERIARECREEQDRLEREALEEQWAMPEQEPKRTLRAQKKFKGGLDP